MLKRFILLLSVFSQSLFFVVPAGASSLLDTSVPALSRKANFIARVKVLSTDVVKKQGFIWTGVNVEIFETFKGRTPSFNQMTVYIPGGKLAKAGGDYEIKVAGAPQLRVGSDYVLFIDHNLKSEGFNLLTNWASYLVSRDSSTGQKYVVSEGERIRRPRMRALSASTAENNIQTYDSFASSIYEGLNEPN